MPLGSVFANNSQTVLSVGKDAVNPIAVGALCVRDTATAPDSWKQAPAAAGNVGPFVVCVNRAAASSDTAFSAALPGTMCTVKGQGVIEVGAEIYSSASVSGAVAAAGTGDKCGRYLGHENELTGKIPGTASADGETTLVIRLGGAT
ncbi:MAG TPA: hypothetical protein VLG09_05190 [Candidatus Saccharimonadales bacterium]|nr:hypothetical protein [Candidatus Saccharimonadales bacterium]